MKAHVRNTITKLIAGTMLAVFAMLIYNQSAFQHTHILADGTVVAHAHPYDKSNDTEPVKNHHHTLIQLSVIQNFSLLFLSACIAFLLVTTTKATSICQCSYLHYKKDLINLLPGRAPPVFS